jgi:hypothetical protein
MPIRTLLVGVRDAQQQRFIKRATHELQTDWQTILAAEAAWYGDRGHAQDVENTYKRHQVRLHRVIFGATLE